MPSAHSTEVTAISICGGVYHERCVWPDWDQIYGSGGRAAAALSGHVDEVTLRAYSREDTAERFQTYVAAVYGFAFDQVESGQTISFEYVHCLSIPKIRPAPTLIQRNDTIQIEDKVALRFGMMEGSACVYADRCVYDPQSSTNPEPFEQNGSSARHLAIVANGAEITALGGEVEHICAAQALLKKGAEVVVAKLGAAGVFVLDSSGTASVPAFASPQVFSIGSGDVFAALFACAWGVHGVSPLEAATLASRGVSEYVNSMSLPTSSMDSLSKAEVREVKAHASRVYLAGPFFSMGQRWLIDEARRCIRELGMEVFSPVHDVGHGPAETIASVDLAELEKCDAVFAVLDGLDSGTLFEVGYARARDKPVYVIAQTVADEDLKMIIGSGCKVFADFVTALHHMAWRL